MDGPYPFVRRILASDYSLFHKLPLGVLALGIYGFAATLQPDPHVGRILAAYGGVFVAGSLARGMIFDAFRPDRWDITGSVICLLGVAVIMFAPRNAS